FGGAVAADTLTIPAGMTAISSMSTPGKVSVPFFYGAYLFLASAGATGAQTWTIPSNLPNLGVSFLIQQGPIWGFTSSNTYGEAATPSRQFLKGQRAAGQMRGDDGIYDRYQMWRNTGWEVQSHQPRIAFQKRAPGMKGKSEFAYSNLWQNAGWEPTRSQ